MEEKQMDNFCVHTLTVDRYVEVTIKIPLKMDVVEFNAVLGKARQLLKISEVELPNMSNSGRPKKYQQWSDEKKINFIKEYQECNNKEEKLALAKTWGLSLTALNNKANYLKSTGISTKTTNKTKPTIKPRTIGTRYDDKIVNEVISLVKKGTAINEIAIKLNLPKKSVYNLAMTRTGKTIAELRTMGGN